jgi:hypothetical protein
MVSELNLFSASCSKMFNRCHNQLDKDLPPLNAKLFLSITAIKLQTLGIKMCKGLQPIRV